MARYTVAITEIVEYLVPVTARSEADAERIGLNKIVMTRNRDQWCVNLRAREVDGVNSDDQPRSSTPLYRKKRAKTQAT